MSSHCCSGQGEGVPIVYAIPIYIPNKTNKHIHINNYGLVCVVHGVCVHGHSVLALCL